MRCGSADDFSPWACVSSGGRERNKIWHESSLGDEDDVRMSNTYVVKRKRTIPHSLMKTHRNVTSVLVTALSNELKAALDLGDDQSRYLCTNV